MSIMHLRITLNDTKPPIWRQVAAPSDIILGELHEVIQIAMGWTDSHMHQFVLHNKAPKPRPQETAQPFRQDARDGKFFDRMAGRRMFVTKQTPWGDPTDMDGEDENAVTLEEICPNVKSKLIYEYDFGDGWKHTIEVKKIVAPEPGAEYPLCLAGKMACPPEDCGGVWGYYELIEAIADPKHEDHQELLDWVGGQLDPAAFDLEQVNATLANCRKN